LELQGKKHQPFSITQPWEKGREKNGGSPSNRSSLGIRSPSRGMRKGVFLWKGCHVKENGCCIENG